MTRHAAVCLIALLMAGCAPKKAPTLEDLLRATLQATYGKDHELVALEKSSTSGEVALCGVVRRPSEAQRLNSPGAGPSAPPPYNPTLIIQTASGQATIGVNATFPNKEWEKYCGTLFRNPVPPIP